MKPALSLRVGQQVRMTPQLQQAIRLMQLSSVELAQEVREAIETNPMLDYPDDMDSDQAEDGEHGEHGEEAEIRQRAEKVLSFFGSRLVGYRFDQPAFTLSYANRRRLEIARALAGEPAFILLDEPFAGIDPISVDDLRREILGLARRRIGVLITDHNVRETLDICDRAYIVNEGHIIAEGNAEAILSNETVRRVYLGERFEL